MEAILTERANGSKRLLHKYDSKTLTEQQHRKNANINTIMAKYKKTGLVPTNQTSAQYGDFTGSADFQESKNRIIQANSNFMELPSDIRSMFNNDAGEFLDFVLDPDNEAEAIKLGLLPPIEVEETETPVQAPIASETITETTEETTPE